AEPYPQQCQSLQIVGGPRGSDRLGESAVSRRTPAGQGAEELIEPLRRLAGGVAQPAAKKCRLRRVLLGLGELIDQYLRTAGIAGTPGGFCACDLASERVRPIWDSSAARSRAAEAVANAERWAAR